MAGDDLETRIGEWREYIGDRRTIGGDADELESHLRDRIDDLTRAGLEPDEAFLIAVRRMGRIDDLSAEFAREHSERLWKQLVRPVETVAVASHGLAVAIGLGVLAGLLVKLPALLTFTPGDSYSVGAQSAGVFVNGVILVLAVLAAFFAVRRRPPLAAVLGVTAGFGVLSLALNLLPFVPSAMTWLLAAIHTPIALWLVLGVLYTAGDWRTSSNRMDFVRFTGEWAVYYVLIALGGAVLIALALNLFLAIQVDIGPFLQQWVLPCGAAGAVIIAAWLVEEKQSVIENIAPVLTKVFSPLVTILLLALIVVGLLQGSLTTIDRDLLILFDVTLLVVLGLLLYSMSARAPLAPPGWFDRLQIALLGSALFVDVLVLVAMLTRIGAFGASPNKLASLGLNVILFANLAWAAWLQVRFVTGRAAFVTLERWQTSYLPVYFVWAVVVVVVFPVLFQYR